MNNIIDYLKDVPQDIYLHFIVGLILYQVLRRKLNHVVVIYLILGIALFKEYLDWDYIINSKRYFEPIKDVFFTLVGATMGKLLWKA